MEDNRTVAPRRYRYTRRCDGIPCTPNAVTSGPYSYGPRMEEPNIGRDEFTVNGIAPATLEELQEITTPPFYLEQMRRDWLVGQLDMYNIPVKEQGNLPNLELEPQSEESEISTADLLIVLKTAYDTGKCDLLPPSLAAMRDRLKLEYDVQFTKLNDRMFDSLEGNTDAEVNADPARFVAKYFLDDAMGWSPDKSKTPVPWYVDVWNLDSLSELQEMVKNVPGLTILEKNDMMFIGWEGTMQAGIDKEFARLEAKADEMKDRDRHHPKCLHTKLAKFDLNMFLNKYLGIQPDGKSVTNGAYSSKPSEPVVLDRWGTWEPENRQFPEELVAKTPGLHLREFKDEDIVVLGWDSAKVEAYIARVTGIYELELRGVLEERAVEKRVREAERRVRIESGEIAALWERRVGKPHSEIVSTAKAAASEGKGVIPEVPDLGKLAGTYVVRWHGEVGSKPGDSGLGHDVDSYNDPARDENVMELDIFPARAISPSKHGIRASFNFGVVKGIMLLGMSRREVEWMRQEQPERPPVSPESPESDVFVWYLEEHSEATDESESEGDGDDGYCFSLLPTPLTPEDEQEEEVEVEDEEVPPYQEVEITLDIFPGANRAPAGGLKRRRSQAEATDVSNNNPEATPTKRQQVETPTVRDTSYTRSHKHSHQLNQQGELSTGRDPNHPNRVYFQMACERTSDHYIFHDPNNSQVGYFDFDPATLFNSAKGQYKLPSMFGNLAQSISIYKVAEPNMELKYVEHEYDWREWGDEDYSQDGLLRRVNPWYAYDHKVDCRYY